MRDTILNFPAQIKEGVKAADGFKIDTEYDRVVVCGMGGSIIPGMMLLMWREHQNKGPGVPVLVNNNYDLPSDTNGKDLIVCISWSGTTEETISAFSTAMAKGAKTVVITKGDKLGQIAQEKNTPLITLPNKSSSPRNSVGYMAGALFAVLDLEEELDFQIKPDQHESEGKDLANKIGDKIPVFYTSYPWRKLGSFWKANINETAKTPAYWNYLPIMSHDELNTYTRKNLPLYPIFFRDPNDYPRNLRDLDAAIAILDKQEYNYSIVSLSGSNPANHQQGGVLETIFNNYILALWTSYYLAENLGVNPEDIMLIEELKKLKKGI